MPHMQLEFDFGMNLGRAPKPARSFSGSNLFLALRPPFDVQDTAYAIGRDASNRYGLTTTLRPKEILHVSLVGLGAFDQVPSEMIENMKRVISRVSFNDFEVMFDQLMSFEVKPAKPLVLCDVAENRMLIDLRRALRDVVNNQVGRKVITSSYKPHMTLLYDHAVAPRT